MSGAPAETTGRIETGPYGLDKIEAQTHDALGSLHDSIDMTGQTAALMSSLVDEAVNGLKQDLKELGIEEADQEKYIAEYKNVIDQKNSEIMADGILDSNEHLALKNFIVDPNNFPSLKKAIEAEKNKGGTGAKILEAKIMSFLDDANQLGMDLGSSSTKKMIAGAIAYIAGMFNLEGMLMNAMERVNPKKEEEKVNLEGQDLLALSKVSDDKAVNEFLEGKVRGFKEMKNGALVLSRADGSGVDRYTFNENTLGQATFQKNNDESHVFGGAISDLNEAIQEHNKNA